MNDPLYNSELWGPNKGKGGQFGKSEKQVTVLQKLYNILLQRIPLTDLYL